MSHLTLTSARLSVKAQPGGGITLFRNYFAAFGARAETHTRVWCARIHIYTHIRDICVRTYVRALAALTSHTTKSHLRIEKHRSLKQCVILLEINLISETNRFRVLR